MFAASLQCFRTQSLCPRLFEGGYRLDAMNELGISDTTANPSGAFKKLHWTRLVILRLSESHLMSFTMLLNVKIQLGSAFPRQFILRSMHLSLLPAPWCC